jgi:glyoxylase-like metal-dependent hydrolase (beta-lactamase superfamily II)
MAPPTPVSATEPVVRGSRVAEGVRRFDDGIVNWYLIEDRDGVALIDAGFPADWTVLETALGTLDRRLSDLRAVVLTHAHFDHVGFAERARREAGATIYVHELDLALAQSTAGMAESERNPLLYLDHAAARRLMLKAMAGAPLARGIRELTTYTDGEVLDDVPGRPRAIHTPGHTDGSCALHLPDRRVLFAGDALVTRDPYTGATGPRIVAAAATTSTEQALASLDRLEGVDADVLLPGHGDPWRGSPAEAVRLARAAGRS